MAVQVPEERVYYYECSAGRFRLVLFLPRSDLERLAAEGRIDEKALRDYPDGLDLDCSTADFEEFEHAYGYRSRHGAEELRAAFLAIFSSTEKWDEFRGSGFLPAADLETCLEPVAPILEETAEAAEPVTRDLTAPAERGPRARQRSALRRKLQSALEELEVDIVDPKKSLREQTFSRIQMSKGEPAPEFFAKVHRQRS